MRTAYFDCFSGISGDMILGALIDVGVSLDYLRNELKKLSLPHCEIKAYRTKRCHISATKVDVIVNEDKTERGIKDIERIIDSSSLDHEIKEKGLLIFQRFAEAEAKIHDVDIDAVHFHEIGALDAIIDVMGAIIGMHSLDVDKIVSSPLNVGYGTVKNAHGNFPVPAPATLELLKGVPVYSGSVEHEMTTPTGAVIISTLTREFRGFSDFEVDQIGYGAGTADFKTTPNLLRLIIGREAGKLQEDEILVVEANIDDMNPEYYDHIIGKFFDAGALDVFLTPIVMKKSRPGIKLTVLVDEGRSSGIKKAFFHETSTFGIRFFRAKRDKLLREVHDIDTKLGKIRVKIGKRGENILQISPEYDDCKKIADQKGISIKEVFQTALESARERLTML